MDFPDSALIFTHIGEQVSIGSFVLMLHSHLPYYRKAGMWPFGEESFYECMAESYIPLLNMIADLADIGVSAKLTVGITPILAEQMADPHLQAGFEKFLRNRIDACLQDEKRFSQRGSTFNPERLRLARFYLSWFEDIEKSYRQRWGRDVISAFAKLQEQGLIEITTSAATHCFSPLLASDSSLACQFKTGVESYKRHFGCAPKGCWLPECAYRPADGKRPAIEKWLYDNQLQFFFTESCVITGGQSVKLRRDFGPYGSIAYIPMADRAPTGLDTFEAFYLKDYPVAVMGRHEKAGFQVWSAEHGYPGDGNYREFHKKDDKSGLHYWRLTSTKTDLGAKELYNPEVALERVKENAEHFVGVIQQALTDHLFKTGKPGLVMVSFDTELFGHWWFEGITFIKEVVRKLKAYTAVNMHTASEYLALCPPDKAIALPESSWGAGGHWQVWLNNETEWMWPIIHQAEHTMESLAAAVNHDDQLQQRVFNQAVRELLLLQSSDWPFLVTTGQAKQYAIERFKTHNERFGQLAEMILSDKIDEDKLKAIEDIDNCFSQVYYPQALPASVLN